MWTARDLLLLGLGEKWNAAMPTIPTTMYRYALIAWGYDSQERRIAIMRSESAGCVRLA